MQLWGTNRFDPKVILASKSFTIYLAYFKIRRQKLKINGKVCGNVFDFGL
jgi:hypothetical protein